MSNFPRGTDSLCQPDETNDRQGIIGVVVWNDNIKNRDELVRLIIENSNMTWFFSPIKSTDTNSALLAR